MGNADYIATAVLNNIIYPILISTLQLVSLYSTAFYKKISATDSTANSTMKTVQLDLKSSLHTLSFL